LLSDISRVVLGVPVNFSSKRRTAVREAAAAAGFDEVFLLAESTAAALGYGLLVAGTKVVLIFDVGVSGEKMTRQGLV
jgi:rod shape-determining protein MreB